MPSPTFLPALVLALAAALPASGARAQTAPGPATRSATAADAASAAPDDAGMARRMQACVVCHGREGRATNAGYFPRIAGKPEGYLFNQLVNFRDGRRRNPAMNHLMRHMSDDYLRDIARYFAGLDLPYPPAKAHGLDDAQSALARRLVFEGIPARGLPACVACHGARMAGRLPAMPGLLTLPSDYLVGQLGAWRTGLRHAMAPDCMGEIARRLSADEASAVARWLSAQTLPPGTGPEADAARNLPLDCGSGR